MPSLLAQTAAEPTHPPTTPEAADKEPTPTKVFQQLAAVTKPLWRQQYRPYVERTVTNRPRAAVALGALMTDLAIAAMARDDQQLRNLVQDQEALEKTLGIADKMPTQRQRYLAQANRGEWPLIARSLEKAHERQAEVLIALRDETLAELVNLGRWVRALQVCTSVVHLKKLPQQELAIGSLELLQTLTTKAEKLAEAAPANDRCLRPLAKKLSHLEKQWRATELTVEQRTERLRSTLEILDELVAQLVQDQTPPSKAGDAKTPTS
jgi:hypothetical protein